MITTTTTFLLKTRLSHQEARKLFLSTAANYLGVPGLLHKAYVLAEDGLTVGGVYLWRSREDAEAVYTEAWRKFVSEKYGTEPKLAFYESPVVVNNQTGEVIDDDVR